MKACVVSLCFLTSLTSIDTYIKISQTHPVSVPDPFTSHTSLSNHDSRNTEVKQKHKDLRTPGTQSIFPYSKLLETRTQKRHAPVTPANRITRHTDQPTLHQTLIQPESLYAHNQTVKQSLPGLPDQRTSSQQDHSSPSSVVQPLELTQTSGFTFYNMNSITSTTTAEFRQYWSQPIEELTATKASQPNNTELVEMMNKNTSKAPMRTTDNNAR